MTALSFRAFDLSDRQAAFTGLLAAPVVAPWLDADHYGLVTRHERDLEKWARRLGYRLQRIDRCVRLRRVPIGGAPAVPRGLPPKRRPLVLALVVAAALEDQREDSITLQEVSDAVRHGTAAYELAPYDPTQRAHRSDLVTAVRILAAHGVLEQRTQRSDLLHSWEREGAGIGAGYAIHRDALVLLIDTRDAELALVPPPRAAENRGAYLLRILIETQALYPLELSEDDRNYLTGQRHRLIAQAEEMTGGTVEVRSDALVLVLPGRGNESTLVSSFPDTTAASWVGLALLDEVVAVARPAEIPGRRVCPAATVHVLAEELVRKHRARLTVPLREGGAVAVREKAAETLIDAGLLDVSVDGEWTLLPTAARYRNAELDAGASEPSALFDQAPITGKETQ
ncbi:MAG: DUF2398 family protein [Propionibacterium sp.]|nr:DUF2398 family protein [Propionibacterium sp.]